VTNNGPSAAQDVTVTDTLPAGTAFVSATPSQGSCAGTTTVICSLGSIANGGVATISLVVNVSAGAVITNTATATTTTSDTNSANNSATATTTVQAPPAPTADLAVTKTDTPDPVPAGNNLTYAITVTNNGPSAAQDVTVTDTLPAGTAFVSATPSQGSCAGTTTVICSLGSIANGGVATISLVVNVSAGAVITNTATATTTTSDTNSANNSATALTTVQAPPAPTADLAVTKTDSPDPVLPGNNLTYAITLTNNGPSDAQNVTLTDPVPTGTTLVSFIQNSGPAGACPLPAGGTGTVTCTFAVLPSGTSASFTMVVILNRDVGGVIANTATATSATADPTSSNNAATASTTVEQPPPQPVADLSVAKTDSPDPVAPGSDLTYTIAVTNNGPADADAATVGDTVPAGTTFVSVTPSQGSCDGTADILCDLGPLANGATAVVTLVVHVDAAVPPGTVISNTATLNPRVVRPRPEPPIGPEPMPSVEPAPRPVPRPVVTDPNPDNDSATATTTVAIPAAGAPSGSPAATSPASPAPGSAAVTATPATAARPVVGRPTFTG
jgi:large repetitive protein